MISKHSAMAFGEPGKLIMSLFRQVPAIPLESIAVAVLAILPDRIASEIPGTSRSITARWLPVCYPSG